LCGTSTVRLDLVSAKGCRRSHFGVALDVGGERSLHERQGAAAMSAGGARHRSRQRGYRGDCCVLRSLTCRRPAGCPLVAARTATGEPLVWGTTEVGLQGPSRTPTGRRPRTLSSSGRKWC
jgi:hypothetical protein